MIVWIAKDPARVIASSDGGGWWDLLKETQTIPYKDDDLRAHIYPRIWATTLLLILVVRANWCLTIETSPSLYRCVLLTYVIPLGQYLLECHYFQTLPQFSPGMAALMIVPWLAIVVGYPKYTKEETTTKKD